MVTKGFKKKKSKRISSKQIRKVEKKVRAYNKKQKRESGKKGGKASKKDPGIPNSLPFKDEVLAELAERKRKDFEQKKAKKQQRNDNKEKHGKVKTLEGMVSDADRRNTKFDAQEVSVDNSALGGLYDNSLKAYYREVKKVIVAADVVLEVLDARDPMGTRCFQLETSVLESGPNKRLVLVLNKCDLIPKENLLAWLKYLRLEFPTIAFKASTQNQKSHLSHSKVPVHLARPDLIKTSKCFGSNMLMKILGNYCRSKNISSSIRVGVVGLPNVGKSSLINSLKRKQTCNVGSTPGVTKTMQEIHLDKHVTLLDSPGVLFTKGSDDVLSALRNSIKVDTIEDPVKPVDTILRTCSKDQLMIHYKLADFGDTTNFLAKVAVKRGYLKKGGLPDLVKAARVILQDWTGGKISYYTVPPSTKPGNAHISAELVSTMSKEFDIDALEDDEQMMIDELPHTDSDRSSVMDTSVQSNDVDMAESETPEVSNVVVNLEPLDPKGKQDDDEWESDDSTQAVEGNQQWSKVTKKVQKRRRKTKTKSNKIANSMAEKLDSVMSI
ncbi:hypothetical protein RvY_05152 [Ramazzottius varieornatus]|uniref:Guanine nucleotide-binding protein-like 3 homolog n=1 Tax=Ramazzottius varieornatus TaxID=947166 RepID=A0A1D1V338_RAMVA|nr:hypothetical protein RvY_05152 [Ramazzottius varieornatus]